MLALAASLALASGDHRMDFYHRHPADPPWLTRAAEFHGHLGPYVALGAMVGDHALRQLHSRGHWLIDVTCSLPPDRHKPPFTCVLDGLQASTGATMGKQNIHLAWAPQRFGDARPAIAVVRPARDDHPAAGVLYKPLPALKAALQAMTPERLEDLSRDLARRRVEDLFDVRPMTPAELTPASAPKE